MDILRKHLLDCFQEHLQKNFDNYCERHHLQKTEDQLLAFLIDQQLIPGTNIQQYTVLQEYERIAAKKEQKKTQVVERLADEFFVSEKTIWNILKRRGKVAIGRF